MTLLYLLLLGLCLTGNSVVIACAIMAMLFLASISAAGGR